MKKSNGVFVGVVVLFLFLTVLTAIENRYYSALDDSGSSQVNLAPLSSRNFCLDRDGPECGTANTALEINIPNGLLVPNPAGGYYFDPSITGIALTTSPGAGVFDFNLNTANGLAGVMRISLLNDKATSATRTVDADSVGGSEPSAGGGDTTGKVNPGMCNEWVSSNSNAGGYTGGPGGIGPVSSPGAGGQGQGADDFSYESPCRNFKKSHLSLAGQAPTAITVSFAGPNGNLPVSGSATGLTIANNQVTFHSNAGYVRAGTSP